METYDRNAGTSQRWKGYKGPRLRTPTRHRRRQALRHAAPSTTCMCCTRRLPLACLSTSSKANSSASSSAICSSTEKPPHTRKPTSTRFCGAGVTGWGRGHNGGTKKARGKDSGRMIVPANRRHRTMHLSARVQHDNQQGLLVPRPAPGPREPACGNTLLLPLRAGPRRGDIRRQTAPSCAWTRPPAPQTPTLW